MAFETRLIDRYKAEGFYRYVEWNRGRGILVKVFGPNMGKQAVSFESVTMDHEYDQRVDDYRQFFLFRRNAVRFMLNMGLPTEEIVTAFRRIDGCQVVYFYVETNGDVRREERSLARRG